MEQLLFEVFTGLNLSRVLGDTQCHMLDYNKHPSMGGAVESKPNSSKPNLQRLLSSVKTLHASR
jgi:hypothetical protein